ncbi:MAG: rane protein [Actinomycetota bacterium]|nr:rane protein [Actinomycetota bacterium]
MITAAKSSFTRAREKVPFLDHLIRMYGRYQADGGDRLAAAVTFYWFLSLFPILLLAISVLGFVYGDRAPEKVSSALSGYLPDQLVTTIGDTLSKAKGRAGVIGLVGLLLSGLGWVDGLREAIRSIWHQNVKAGNFITQKLTDIVVLVGLFATIAASVLITGATTAATDWVIGVIHQSHTAAATVFTQVLAYLLSAVADTALFVYMFTRLPRISQPITKVLRSAVFGAVGFEILKFAGAFYVARTTSKGQATYGTFAVVVGLLLFLNLISRLILLTAAFAVTKPYDSDVLPSGTATPEQAVKAGIPPEYADNDDPDDPPALLDDGAPTPLQPAVEGQRPPKDEPTGRESQQSSVTAYPESPFDPVPAPAPAPPAAGVKGEAVVRTAGRAGAAVIGMTLMALAVYVLRTFRTVLLRR